MVTLKNIDWALLRQQKEWLLNNGSDEAMGLAHFLDFIQDDAVANQGFSDDDVFGKQFIILGLFDPYEGEQLYWIEDFGWGAGRDSATRYRDWFTPTLIEETGREYI